MALQNKRELPGLRPLGSFLITAGNENKTRSARTMELLRSLARSLAHSDTVESS